MSNALYLHSQNDKTNNKQNKQTLKIKEQIYYITNKIIHYGKRISKD